MFPEGAVEVDGVVGGGEFDEGAAGVSGGVVAEGVGAGDDFVIGGGDDEAAAGEFEVGIIEVEAIAQEEAGGNPGVMMAGDFGEAEERGDENEGVELLRIFCEDRFGDAGAEALTAKDDLRVAVMLGFEGAERGGFEGTLGRSAGTFAVAGVLEHEDVAGKFGDGM